MSVENISAICVAIGSGTLASSVAANSDVRTVPVARRVVVPSGSVSTLLAKPCSPRLMVRREKWVENWSSRSAG